MFKKEQKGEDGTPARAYMRRMPLAGAVLVVQWFAGGERYATEVVDKARTGWQYAHYP